MDRRFEQRKREIEADAKINPRATAGAVRRLQQFGEPYFKNFRRSETRAHAQIFLEGLLSDVRKKNIESIAYRSAQDRQALQRFIGQVAWDHKPLLDRLVDQVAAAIGEPDGILAFDPSAIEKDGKMSAGVARQYLGRHGKVDNGQVGTFCAYVTRKEHVLVNFRLFIPQEWNDDSQRCERAHIPKSEYEKHKTRHDHILEMLDEYGKLLPHQWITGDDELGKSSSFRRELRHRNESYVLAVPSNTNIRDLDSVPAYSGRGAPPKGQFIRVDKWREGLQSDAWQSIDVRDGEKGPLVLKLAMCRVLSHTELGQQEQQEERLIVVERPEGKGVRHDYYLTNNFDAPIEELARVILGSHRVEDCFRRAKSECGLANYEVRTWHGWNHHMTFVLLACWFLTKETMRAKKKDCPSMTVPLMQRVVASQLRRYVTRVRPGWFDFDIQKRSLRSERAYFYHYKKKNILPPRRYNQRL